MWTLKSLFYESSKWRHSSYFTNVFTMVKKRSKFNFVSSRTESKLCLWLHLVAGFKNMVFWSVIGQFYLSGCWLASWHFWWWSLLLCLLDKTGNDSHWLIETLFLIGLFPIGHNDFLLVGPVCLDHPYGVILHHMSHDIYWSGHVITGITVSLVWLNCILIVGLIWKIIVENMAK